MVAPPCGRNSVKCATHPNVETELRCGRCDKPICPQCMIQTPGGQRCRDCARLRRPPMYEVGPFILVRGGLAALGAGLAGGIIWRFLPFAGFFLFFLAAGLGYVMAEAIGRATNRKRGYRLQVIAGFGIVLAYFVHNLLLGRPLLPLTDIFGYLAVLIAIVVAINPLR